MQKIVFFLLASGFFSAHAQTCPQLDGTFRCREARPFDLSVVADVQQGFLQSYTMSDPTGVRTFVPDGQTYDLQFKNGRGVYRARCEGNALLVEVRNPQGEVFHDRYYIERAALVRVRRSQTQASSLSCAPTQGTWHRYPQQRSVPDYYNDFE